MADNVNITEGAGKVVASDEIAGVNYQRVKLVQGADGVNDGDICSAAPLNVTLPAAQIATLTPLASVNVGTVTTMPVVHTIIDSGNPTTITATQATGTNLHTVVDSGAVTATLANSAKVDCNSSNVTIAGGSIANTSFAATQGTASSLKTEAHLYDSSTNGIGSTSNALDINIKSGSIANTSFTATQSTATNLKTQSETYQGGTAVSTSNPMQVSLANTGSNATSINVAIASGNPTTITATQATGTNLHTVVDSGAITNTEALLTVAAKTIKVAYTASGTGTTILTPTNGHTAYITDIVISATGAGTIYLYDTTDDSTHGIGPILSFSINGGWSSNFRKPYICQSTSAIIKATTGAGATGSIWISYYEV